MQAELQNGKTVYSDGTETERRMLEIAKTHPEDASEDFIAQDYGYTVNNTFSAVRRNILNWYPFRAGAAVLEVGAGMGSLTGLLCDRCARVTAVEMNALRADVIRARYPQRDNLNVVTGNINDLPAGEKFDYAVFIGVLEYAAVFSDASDPFTEFLTSVRKFLKEDGTLLFAIENRFGLRYWCGASEDHLQEPFLGIRGYSPKSPRTFSKSGLEGLLLKSGFTSSRFYYAMPDYKFPTMIFTDEWLPQASDFEKIAFGYGKNSVLWADERRLYKDVLENGAAGFFANSFLVEASALSLPGSHVVYASARSENKKEYRIVTTIDSSRKLTKTAVHPNSREHLKHIKENEDYLISRGISVLPMEWDGDGLSRPLCDLERADEYLERCITGGDRDELFRLLNLLGRDLLRSSELSISESNLVTRMGLDQPEAFYGLILEKGFVDMTFYNAFLKDGSLVFFDQEWCLPDVPLNFILYYAVKKVFERSGRESGIGMETICTRLGINDATRAVYDALEPKLWASVMYRWGDLYGGDGYYNLYYSSRTLDKALDKAAEADRLEQENASQAAHIEQLILSERELRGLADNRAAHIEQLIQSERELRGLADNRAAHIEQLIQSERELRELADNRAAHIEQLLQNERALMARIKEKSQTLNALTEETGQALTTLTEEKNGEIAALNEAHEKENAELRQVIRNKNGHIEQLLQSDRELERILSSRSWRFMRFFWKLRDILAPKGSKRRLFVKTVVKFFKHPVRFLKKATPKRIAKYFRALRREGTESVSHRLDECLVGTDVPALELEVSAVSDSQKAAADYARLTVPQWDRPRVSIVIPCYNQFEYTYNCIESIVENSGDITYEIIIADDRSSDLTSEIRSVIDGLVVVRNKENLRFLKNCNHAAKRARGEFILFLNNDTQVQDNWLAPLVELMDRDGGVGLTGSKLVYPDGRLQEAGGIIWKDASAWNYGHGRDPELPEFNYVRETDYISGASIMIRRALWEGIGGFDGRFAPAYCEDSDLAFEVRKHGYKVIYQPLSVVVHFEGVSNGTDVSAGQKSYQAVNQQKFYEKWKDVLEKEHFQNGENVFLARDRSRRKKTVLFVDHYVPMYDKDAGSRTVFQYVKLFISQGYRVKFIGDNFYRHEPYTTVLQQLGAEVLYGPYYAGHWKGWIQENHAWIGYAFLNRPHIAVKYIDWIRKCTKAKIVYYGHDLHFLRESREYEITGEREKLRSSEEWKQKELSLMRKADMAYYPSEIEVETIQAIDPGIRVKAIPAYLFEAVSEQPYAFEKRDGLMFIGGFGHAPNVDGVKWFASEVMPELEKLLPGVVVNILGSNVPPEIRALDGGGLRIVGFVTDQELEKYYASCRAAVVPLRYGAGIKGKVVEAMWYGTPVITTTIGAEGILGAENVLCVEDNPRLFAGKIAQLYSNEKELRRLSKGSRAYVKEHYSPANAVRVIGPEFDFKGMER